MQTTIQFAYVDVFAEQPLTGNPLTVVPDADDLTAAQMRAIAREFNQSETTFLLRPTHADALWQLKSYTPGGVEVGGAGHNALGAWLWLAHQGQAGEGSPRRLVQQIGADLLPVEIQETDAGVQVIMEQSAPHFGAHVPDLDALSQSLGLEPGEVTDGQTVSTGVGHLMVGVTSREVVDRVTVNPPALMAILRAADAEGCYVYTRDEHAYTRFFNPTVGIAEDPATGTAAGPLAALLTSTDPALRDQEIVIHQGHAAGRPSRLRLRVLGDKVLLAGSGLVVGEGWLSV